MSNEPPWDDSPSWGSNTEPNLDQYDPDALSYLQEIMTSSRDLQANVNFSSEIFSAPSSNTGTGTFVSEGFQHRLEETQSESQRTRTITQVRIYSVCHVLCAKYAASLGVTITGPRNPCTHCDDFSTCCHNRSTRRHSTCRCN